MNDARSYYNYASISPSSTYSYHLKQNNMRICDYYNSLFERLDKLQQEDLLDIAVPRRHWPWFV